MLYADFQIINLLLFFEQLLAIKWGKLPFGMNFGNMGSSAVYLGWDTKASGNIASYSTVLPENGISVGTGTLVFLLADANEYPNANDQGKKHGRANLLI